MTATLTQLLGTNSALPGVPGIPGLPGVLSSSTSSHSRTPLVLHQLHDTAFDPVGYMYSQSGNSRQLILEDSLAQMETEETTDDAPLLSSSSSRSSASNSTSSTTTTSTSPLDPKRFQPRMGAKDWEIIINLYEFHAQHLELFQEFAELVHRKSVSNNSRNVRVNLATVPQKSLRELYEAVKKSQYVAKTGELMVDLDLIKTLGFAVSDQKKHRRFCTVIKTSIGTTIVYVYSVMFYFEPSPCWYFGSNGRFCGKYHRTIFDYAAAHPTVDVSQLGLSHLHHQSYCTDPSKMVIETNSTNSKRNICKRVCVCKQNPECFTDPRSLGNC